jgi:ABC-type enterochelin transport system permease subunit
VNFVGLDAMTLATVAFFCTVAAVCGITLGRVVESRAIIAISVICGVFGSIAMLVLLRRVLPS